MASNTRLRNLTLALEERRALGCTGFALDVTRSAYLPFNQDHAT